MKVESTCDHCSLTYTVSWVDPFDEGDACVQSDLEDDDDNDENDKYPSLCPFCGSHSEEVY